MTIMIHKQLPGHFNSIRYISMVSFFIFSFFFFVVGIFPLCLRPWQSLACPTVHRTDVRCRNLKVVLTVAKIEFLFNLYGFVRWPAPSSHFLLFLFPVALMRTLYLVSWWHCPAPIPSQLILSFVSCRSWNLFHIIALDVVVASLFGLVLATLELANFLLYVCGW